MCTGSDHSKWKEQCRIATLIVWSSSPNCFKDGLKEEPLAVAQVKMIYKNTVTFLMLHTNTLIQNCLYFLQRRRYSHHTDSSESRGEQQDWQAECRKANATAQFHTEEKTYISCKLNGSRGREHCSNWKPLISAVNSVKHQSAPSRIYIYIWMFLLVTDKE